MPITLLALVVLDILSLMLTTKAPQQADSPSQDTDTAQSTKATGPMHDYQGLKTDLLPHHVMQETARAMHLALSEGRAEDARELRDKMIVHNMRLVVSVATKYQMPGFDLQDLVQAGMLGLMKAVDGWNPDSGNKFSTYAATAIANTITRDMTNTGHTIRVPNHAARLLGVARDSFNENERNPSAQELAERGEASLKVATDTLHARRPIESLSTPDGNSREDIATESADGELDEERKHNERAIERALTLLPDEEAVILRHLHKLGDGKFLSPAELAALLERSEKELEKQAKHIEGKLLRLLKAA
ncbi:MAG: sigma-70 family RNA polymerase sigma factor [Oligoflexia bacterium]|nr:sigma-70 family RNA polymerase sigma factor [Oligoflexia bacterium]